MSSERGINTFSGHSFAPLSRDPREQRLAPDRGRYTTLVQSAPAFRRGWLTSIAAALARRYAVLATAVLCLAAVNLGVRLDREIVTEWDEAMYSLTASEMVASGNWVGTTIHGELDYYNAKPPLNVWLIAVSFKLFGQSLVALRLPSAIAAWLTILGVMMLARRAFGPAVALVAGVVLSTNFGFIFVHAGRSADPDALLALLILVTVATLWVAHDKPSRLIWLGPVVAGIFLLKGMAALMALAIIAPVELGRWRTNPRRWAPLGIAAALFMLPVGLWAVLRWRVDGFLFLRRVVYDDFIGHSTDVLDGHAHGPLFFLNLLQKHEYGWLVAVTAALLLAPIPRERWRQGLRFLGDISGRGFIFAVWAAVAMLVPSVMGTKLPWYLNSFYPAFAVGTAWILVKSWSMPRAHSRRLILGCVFAVVFVAAEARLAWYSFHHRDVTTSVQGLLLAEKPRLEGHVVFATHWDNAEAFVLRALVGSRTAVAADLVEFLTCSAEDDYLLWPSEVSAPGLTLVRSDGVRWLYRRQVLVANDN